MTTEPAPPDTEKIFRDAMAPWPGGDRVLEGSLFSRTLVDMAAPWQREFFGPRERGIVETNLVTPNSWPHPFVVTRVGLTLHLVEKTAKHLVERVNFAMQCAVKVEAWVQFDALLRAQKRLPFYVPRGATFGVRVGYDQDVLARVIALPGEPLTAQVTCVLDAYSVQG